MQYLEFVDKFFGRKAMFEKLDKLMMAGLGVATMTREKAEQLFDESVEKGKASKEDRGGFVKDVMDRAEESRKDLEKLISDQIRHAVNGMELATKDDIKRIEVKLDLLLAK